MGDSIRACVRAVVFGVAAAACGWGSAAHAADPFASNNGLYPAAADWKGPYRTADFDFPAAPSGPNWATAIGPRQPLTPATAPRYVDALKRFVAGSLRGMVENPDAWSRTRHGWYDMPWQGTSSTGANGAVDPTGGREALLGSFSGQVILKDTFGPHGLGVDMQNHTVVYYDPLAATMLRNVWANPFSPDRKAARFPEGAIVVKAAGASPTPQEWPVLEGAAVWNVFRPPVADVIRQRTQPGTPLVPKVTPLRLLQFDIIVKDSVASPQTGWVFVTFIHDRAAPGSPWDKLVPLGAMWGNDPAFANQPDGRDPKGGALQETWINPAAPAYAKYTLGWGGRLSGPIDVSLRHQVVLTTGERVPQLAVSSCLSCHGTAQFPMVANLYPSPNKSFPPEGQPFMMYPPGSTAWARWFQNRPGHVPQNGDAGAVGLDYDMLLMFALSEFDATAGNDKFVQRLRRVH